MFHTYSLSFTNAYAINIMQHIIYILIHIITQIMQHILYALVKHTITQII